MQSGAAEPMFLTQYGSALIGLFGVLIGAFITPLIDSLKTRRERQREASYAAIRIVSILEEYIDACIDVVRDNGTYLGEPASMTNNGERFHAAQIALPSPFPYPEDIAWESLKSDYMNRILSLPNMARDVNRAIDASGENALPPDYTEVFDARQEGYARLALEALDIIRQLRAEFSIKSTGRINLHGTWDKATFLKYEIEVFEKQRPKI